MKDKIDNCCSKLKLKEKIDLLSGIDFWHTENIDRLEIPSLTLADGPHGIRRPLRDDVPDDEVHPATSFPILAAVAATWNQNLAEKLGQAIGDEARYYGVDVLLAPGINGKRTPVGGRNFEYFSEDPYLTAEMAKKYVRGVQSRGIGTSIKHYVANEQETNRMVVSSKIDERALREIYLYPFEQVVKEAQPWTIMCSYNQVNGVPMTSNKKYLNQVLRKEWKFNGLIVSDWMAVDERIDSLLAGLDLEMPGPGTDDDVILNSIKEGKLTKKVINKRVKKVLELIFKSKIQKEKTKYKLNLKKNHQLAREIAGESFVLLENEDDLLPLDKNSKLAIIGEFARDPRYKGAGSSNVTPHNLEIPFEKIASFAKQIDFCSGYSGKLTDESLINEAQNLAADNDTVIIFTGTTESMETEGQDRENIDLPIGHRILIKEVSKVNENIIVVNNSGSAVDFGPILPQLKALLHTWLFGEGGAGALAEILFGQRNPSGKLSETFPLKYEHNPAFLNFPGTVQKVEYREGIYVGYRYYDTKNLEVRYPFGYGNSYTTFEYSNLELSSKKITNKNKQLQVKLKIKNTGKYKGKEVVQIYVRDCEKKVKRPQKELKAFKKVELSPGEKREISLNLKWRNFSFYSEKLGRFAVPSGKYKIIVGSSSRDIRLQSEIEAKSSDNIKSDLTINHSIGDFLANEETKEKMEQLLDKIGVNKASEEFAMIKGFPFKKTYFLLKEKGYNKEEIKEFYQVFNFDIEI